jgi:hypothetical protein
MATAKPELAIVGQTPQRTLTKIIEMPDDNLKQQYQNLVKELPDHPPVDTYMMAINGGSVPEQVIEHDRGTDANRKNDMLQAASRAYTLLGMARVQAQAQNMAPISGKGLLSMIRQYKRSEQPVVDPAEKKIGLGRDAQPYSERREPEARGRDLPVLHPVVGKSLTTDVMKRASDAQKDDFWDILSSRKHKRGRSYTLLLVLIAFVAVIGGVIWFLQSGQTVPDLWDKMITTIYPPPA